MHPGGQTHEAAAGRLPELPAYKHTRITTARIKCGYVQYIHTEFNNDRGVPKYLPFSCPDKLRSFPQISTLYTWLHPFINGFLGVYVYVFQFTLPFLPLPHTHTHNWCFCAYLIKCLSIPSKTKQKNKYNSIMTQDQGLLCSRNALLDSTVFKHQHYVCTMYVCMYVCMYVQCMYVCMYVCIHVHV